MKIWEDERQCYIRAAMEKNSEAENEALKACLMKEIVTPLKDKWEYSDTIMRRFMKLIETYPDSLFLVAVEAERDE